jgi:hypothetical protein
VWTSFIFLDFKLSPCSVFSADLVRLFIPAVLALEPPPHTACPPIGPQTESAYGLLYKYTNRHATYITSKSTALKMEQIESSETSANINQTPGKHPKENTLNFLFCDLYLILIQKRLLLDITV